MRSQHNTSQVKHLLRVLDTLNGFELVICGYQSLAVSREMLELVGKNLRVKKIDVVEIDASTLPNAREFENLLKKKRGEGKQYRVFNIIRLEHHVKAGKVSRFLNQLNLLRDQLAADYPYGLFFWLPENLVARFALDAPDLWAWRNTSVVFEDKEMRGELRGIPTKVYDEENFENFTLEEKERQIEYLQDALKKFQKKPQSLKREKKLFKIYSNLGKLLSSRGDFDPALDYYKKSLDICTVMGEKEKIAETYSNIGLIYLGRGDYNLALEFYQRSLEIAEHLGNQSAVASVYTNIGMTHYYRGDYETALKTFKQSLETFRESGDKAREGIALHNISQVLYARGEYDVALEYLEQSLAISKEIGNKHTENIALNNIGQIYHARGDYDTALLNYVQSLEISKEMGDKAAEGLLLHNIGQIHYELGNYDTALELLEKSLMISKEIGDLGKYTGSRLDIRHSIG
jgi:tetratricopeptide (TPR) repeat protein